jgi:hypothetical protein
MIFDGVSRLLSYQFFQIIQVIQRKFDDTTASVADNVMVVMFALFHQFIPDYTIPEYDPPKQSKSSQKFDGSVNGRFTYSAIFLHHFSVGFIGTQMIGFSFDERLQYNISLGRHSLVSLFQLYSELIVFHDKPPFMK